MTTPRHGRTTPRHGRTLRSLAWACVLLMLLVTSVSAWLRLAQPRAPCADWPECRSTQSAEPGRVAPTWLGATPVLDTVRKVHRLAATLALLVALGLVVISLRQRPRRHAGHALALLALALGLALLGIVTPGSRAPAVLLGNMLGGLLMLAVAWQLTRRLAGEDAGGPTHHAPDNHAVDHRMLGRWALLGALLWAAQAALGAISGVSADALVPRAHVMLALATGPWALVVGGTARRLGLPRQGTALMALAAGQVALGGIAAWFTATPGLVLTHNIVAAVGMALLFGLMGPANAPTRMPQSAHIT